MSYLAARVTLPPGIHTKAGNSFDQDRLASRSAVKAYLRRKAGLALTAPGRKTTRIPKRWEWQHSSWQQAVK